MKISISNYIAEQVWRGSVCMQLKQRSHRLDSKLNQQDLLSQSLRIPLWMIEFFIELSWTLWFSAVIPFKRRSSLKVLEKNLSYYKSFVKRNKCMTIIVHEMCQKVWYHTKDAFCIKCCSKFMELFYTL